MYQKLVYIIIDRRFLTSLCCVRNDALPHGGETEAGIGGSAADSRFLSSFKTPVIPNEAKRNEESKDELYLIGFDIGYRCIVLK